MTRRCFNLFSKAAYDSAILMFENFGDFLAMEGKPNVGWRPVYGSELDTIGATLTSTSGVNDPVAFGYAPGEGRASRGRDKEPHEEIHEGVNREMEVGNEIQAWPATPIQNTTTNIIVLISSPSQQDQLCRVLALRPVPKLSRINWSLRKP